MTTGYGLGWENEGIQGSVPYWTAEPSVEIVTNLAYQHLELSVDEIAESAVKFQFGGTFNKLYAIECPRESFFLRVTLPVDPHFKTLSETATIRLLKSRKLVPVPRIIASDASADNVLKFEWTLMERVAGVPLEEMWSSLGWDAKVTLVKDIASILAQLFELRYNCIGNLFRVADVSNTSQNPSEKDAAGSCYLVDRLVSMLFFFNKRLALNVPRGPFASSRDWIDAKLQILEGECKSRIESGDADKDYFEDLEEALELIARLRKNVPTFFPLDSSTSEEFALHHGDISRANLIVDETGKLQALVDWECVSVMPLWKGCQIPSFLITRERTEPLDLGTYDLTDENTLYYEHFDEWQCTHLRKILLDEMEQLAPQWKMEYDTAHSKRDFDQAVECSDGGWGMVMAKIWLDFFEAGGDYLGMSDAWDRKLGIVR